MEKYHKIQTVFKRDPENNYKTLLWGEWALPEFEFLAYNKWVFTEKVHGTNIRIGWECDEIVRVGGKTDRAQTPPFLLDELHNLFPVSKFEDVFPETPMTLYGEGYGAKIQKGGGNYIPDGQSFILFDVMIGGYYLERHNVRDIAEKLEIDMVSVVDMGTLFDAARLAEVGFASLISESVNIAEGLVMRPEIEMLNRRGRRIISKIKYKDFPH